MSDHPILFHTGLVVDDLRSTMSNLSAAVGVEWAEPARIEAPLLLEGTVVVAERWIVYSVGLSHALELIEQVSGDAFAPADGSPRLHHLGFWVDDLASESDRLEGLGLPLRATGPASANDRYFAYHSMGSGFHVELLSTARRPALERWFQGGALGH